MLFSVIYEASVGSEDRIAEFAPPHVRRRIKGQRVWELTECNDHADDDPRFCKHRKWCALLDAGEFREFVDETELEADDVETMGSIGAPGFGICWAPAISFNGTDEWAYRNAYVTPVPVDQGGQKRVGETGLFKDRSLFGGSRQAAKLLYQLPDVTINSSVLVIGDVGRDESVKILLTVPMGGSWLAGVPFLPAGVGCRSPGFLAEPVHNERQVGVQERVGIGQL